MICDAILTFVLVFNDGHKESREKWVDQEVASEFITKLNNPEFLKEYIPEIKNVENIKVKIVPDYNCLQGPKK